MRLASVFILWFCSPSRAEQPTQVDPTTIRAHKRMLEACEKMERASRIMIDSADKLTSGGDLDAAKRALARGDAMMRASDRTMKDAQNMLMAQGGMMDSSKLMMESSQLMMDGRERMTSALAPISTAEQLPQVFAAISEARRKLVDGRQKMIEARKQMWSRMQMAR